MFDVFEHLAAVEKKRFLGLIRARETGHAVSIRLPVEQLSILRLNFDSRSGLWCAVEIEDLYAVVHEDNGLVFHGV
jgi:hypothetical protein